ncbi:BspA family leucine-rich repeat surface protein [Chryseobacterium populi]|uniref:Surface protein 26-residue repeat-containing protein n=1 Tax=Chryseobacterium populi TaxID=1144316 RepID=J3CEK9_9FLAO|nr:BspA family leucine-rich repeat surface protein [Chryseobacterium populi]EJL70059.1 surface protein 26-residue repeat-containing protein [Chryseobacterium populi]
MLKKLLALILFVILFQIISAQDEFITVWKPGSSQQINFPGRGTNFTVYWEEVGYPQHNGSLTHVTSTLEFPVNFGVPLNPAPANATYRIKISNGNGNFDRVRFFDGTLTPGYTNADHTKIIDIAQWGNIQWKSFEDAFVFCTNLDVSAPDAPDLSLVTSMKQMFYLCFSLVGNPSFNTWDTSTVTTMFYMFGDNTLFNQPIGNWNVSNVTDISYMFDYAMNFNYPLESWNTSNVTSMIHMFHGASSFNQNLKSWDTSKVTTMEEMFHEASSFNQNLGQWNLTALAQAQNMFLNSGLNCQNYDNTLYGWSMNPATPNNINLASASPLVYAAPFAVNARNNLTSIKGWIILADTYNNQCSSQLSTIEVSAGNGIVVYPNPAKDVIYVKNAAQAEKYRILDASGRILAGKTLTANSIDIRFLNPGNYMLQIITKERIQNFKFIKK